MKKSREREEALPKRRRWAEEALTVGVAARDGSAGGGRWEKEEMPANALVYRTRLRFRAAELELRKTLKMTESFHGSIEFYS